MRLDGASRLADPRPAGAASDPHRPHAAEAGDRWSAVRQDQQCVSGGGLGQWPALFYSGRPCHFILGYFVLY